LPITNNEICVKCAEIEKCENKIVYTVSQEGSNILSNLKHGHITIVHTANLHVHS